MLYLTCTTITSVDLAHYGASRAKDWVSVYCGTKDNGGAIVKCSFFFVVVFSWLRQEGRTFEKE